jgi:hypothetical protein
MTLGLDSFLANTSTALTPGLEYRLLAVNSMCHRVNIWNYVEKALGFPDIKRAWRQWKELETAPDNLLSTNKRGFDTIRR